eukprot:s2641_g9.t1
MQKATAFAVVEDTITPREQVQHEEVIVGRLVDHSVAANMPRGTLSAGTSPMASAPATETKMQSNHKAMTEGSHSRPRTVTIGSWRVTPLSKVGEGSFGSVFLVFRQQRAKTLA